MNIRIHSSNVSYAGLCCVLGSFLAADAREVYPLNGSWDFSFNGGPAGKVAVPHTWNAEDAANGVQGKREDAKSVNSGAYRRGPAVYSRTLPVEPKPGKRYFIRGGGASIVSEVSVNGKAAGRHEGAFTAFCYEITPLLKKGANTISVLVDNTQQNHIAPQRGDFSMFGGLYRPIELIETDGICIDPLFYASPGIFVTTKSLSESRAEVEVKALLNSDGKAGEVDVAVDILDMKGRKVAGKTVKAAGEKNRLEVPVTLAIANPVLWNGVKNPYLYQVKTSIRTADGQTDEMVQPLGLRTVSVNPKEGFVLNGKAMQIKGVSRHQDMKGKGWALSPEDEARDIRLIADMGADGVRTGHYPASTNVYDLCDKAGLVVWSEVPNVNLVWDTPEFRENNRLQAREMIFQHWNHPSICMWGIFNEIGHQPEASTKGVDMEAELTALNKFVKETDPSRMTVGASNQPGRKKLNNIPDHIAFNTYPGWYGGGPETMKGNLNSYIRDYGGKMGIAVSEYGHGASAGMHENPARRPSPTGFWHPEEWQSHAHEVNYRCIRERPEVWGAFVWNMFDFGSSSRFEGESPGINDKGLVTYDRKTPKDAYFFYRANWSPRPTVYITSRRFAERTEKTVPVKVYCNGSVVKLSVNGKAVGSVKPDDLKRAVWPEVTLKPGLNTITATASIGGKTYTDSCKWTLKPAGGDGKKDSERYQDPSLKKYK